MTASNPTRTAILLKAAMGDRTRHQACVAWGITWESLDRYLNGRLPSETMIRALAWNPEIDEAQLRAAIAADRAATEAVA